MCVCVEIHIKKKHPLQFCPPEGTCTSVNDLPGKPGSLTETDPQECGTERPTVDQTVSA